MSVKAKKRISKGNNDLHLSLCCSGHVWPVPLWRIFQQFEGPMILSLHISNSLDTGQSEKPVEGNSHSAGGHLFLFSLFQFWHLWFSLWHSQLSSLLCWSLLTAAISISSGRLALQRGDSAAHVGGIKSEAAFVPPGDRSGDRPWWAALCMAVQGTELGSAVPVPPLAVPRCASQHGAWGAAFSGSSHIKKQILTTVFLLQEEENVGGKDTKPQQESPDPELPRGKRELFLEGFIISLSFSGLPIILRALFVF